MPEPNNVEINPAPSPAPNPTPNDGMSVRRTLKNAGMLMFGTLFRMVVSFAFTVYAADQLGLFGFGVYSIGVHYFELLLSLSATGIAMLATKEIARWPKRENELVSAALIMGFLVAILTTLVLVAIAFIPSFSAETTKVLLIASVALLPASLSAICEGILIARERSEFVALAISVESGLRTIASIIAIMLGYGLLTLFLILIISRCIQLVLFGVLVKRVNNLQIKFSSRAIARLFNRWRVYAAETWMATIYIGLDTILLSIVIGETAVGVYEAAWKVICISFVISRAYASAVFPVLTRLHQKSRAQMNRLKMDTIRLAFTFTMPLIGIVIVLSSPIIDTIYFSGEFEEAKPVLAVMSFVMIQQLLNSFLSFLLFASERQNDSLKVSAVGLIVNLLLSALLILPFGVVGAAIATVIAGFAATCSYAYFALDRAEIKQTLKFIGSSLVATGLLIGPTLLVQDSANFSAWALGAAMFAGSSILLGGVCKEDLLVLKSLVRKPPRQREYA